MRQKSVSKKHKLKSTIATIASASILMACGETNSVSTEQPPETRGIKTESVEPAPAYSVCNGEVHPIDNKVFASLGQHDIPQLRGKVSEVSQFVQQLKNQDYSIEYGFAVRPYQKDALKEPVPKEAIIITVEEYRPEKLTRRKQRFTYFINEELSSKYYDVWDLLYVDGDENCVLKEEPVADGTIPREKFYERPSRDIDEDEIPQSVMREYCNPNGFGNAPFDEKIFQMRLVSATCPR